MKNPQDYAYCDFFISRTGADKDAALVVDKILRGAGYTTFIQDRDFGATAFTERMDESVRMVEAGARIVALLSHTYQTKPHCEIEARYPLIDDPSNIRQRLVVLRIEDCAPMGFLKPIPYVDLVPVLHDADAFRRAIIGAVDPEKHKPEAAFSALYRRSGQQIIHPEVREVPGFTAREAELAAIESALWGGAARVAITGAPLSAGAPRKNNRTSVALSGLGGVGKSVLAQQYAWVQRERYKGVWWVRAETRETLLDDLVALGARLMPGLAEHPDRGAAAATLLDHIAQSPVAEKPWLLVYDNVETPEAIHGLTPANGAHVVLTTRFPDWDALVAEVPVGVFASEAALAFLMARARTATARPAETRAEAAALAEDLGRLPLALAVARAHAWSMSWSFAQYRRHVAAALELQPGQLRGAVNYKRSIAETFRLALERAIFEVPAAATLAGVVSFLGPDAIPVSMLVSIFSDELEVADAIVALAEASLVQREVMPDGQAAISVHRLVQVSMRNYLDVNEQEKYLNSAIALVTAAIEKVEFEDRASKAELLFLSHGLSAFSFASETAEQLQSATKLASKLSARFFQLEMFDIAEPLMRRSLAIDESSVGPDHPNVAIHLNNLASLLQATGRLDAAEPLMRRSLAIDESSYGPDHPNVAIRLNNLAFLLQATNRLPEAEPLMRRALAIDEASLGPDHPNVAIRLNNLAQLLQATHRLAEAEPLMRRALAIDEASLGPDHPDVARDLNNLATLLHATNRLPEAEPLMRRVIAIFETTFGPDHPNVATSLNNLAGLLQATNRLPEAEPLMRRALSILEVSLPDHHPWVVGARANLAALLTQLGR